MIRACTLKLRLRPRDVKALDYAIYACRLLYNAALEGRRDAYRKAKKSLSFFDQCKELTALRAEDPLFDALDATMLRMTSLQRVDNAFKAFFRRCKSGDTPGFPRYKGRAFFHTLVFGTTGWKLTCGKLRLSGIGTFRITGKMHRQGVPRGLRVVRTVRGTYVHVLLDVGTAPTVAEATAPVGIDVGLTKFATLSDGRTIDHPRFLRSSMVALLEAQRAVSSACKGSRRREHAKHRLGVLHAKIAARRKDFVWQVASSISKRYDGFAVEDLDIAEMVTTKEENGKQKRGLRRGIMDSAWGLFGHALACKAEEAGKPCRRVEPRGTSQRCSGCGTIVKKTLRERVHRCPACGLTIDRDLNASFNIRDLGWRSAPPSGAEDPVLWDLHPYLRAWLACGGETCDPSRRRGHPHLQRPNGAGDHANPPAPVPEPGA